MTTIKCVGFSKGLVAVTRHKRFRLGATIVWDIGAGARWCTVQMCRVPRVWLESLGTSDFDSGPDPPMVRRSNVSGSEGLVPAARHQRFRLGFEPGSAPSIERSQGADLGECASRSSLLSCKLQVEGGGVCY